MLGSCFDWPCFLGTASDMSVGNRLLLYSCSLELIATWRAVDKCSVPLLRASQPAHANSITSPVVELHRYWLQAGLECEPGTVARQQRLPWLLHRQVDS